MMLQEVLHAWLPGMDQDRLGIPGIMRVQDSHLQRRPMPLPQPTQQPQKLAMPAKGVSQCHASRNLPYNRVCIGDAWTSPAHLRCRFGVGIHNQVSPVLCTAHMQVCVLFSLMPQTFVTARVAANPVQHHLHQAFARSTFQRINNLQHHEEGL